MFFLKLLGGVSLSGDAGRVGGPVAQRHRLALLALLASSREEGLSRDKLVGYLWPERDAEHARNSLKQAVHVVRRALGQEAVLSAGDVLRLNPARVRADVVAFLDAVDAADAARAVSLYTGEFLDGFFLPGSPEFERWVDLERVRLRDAASRALETLAGRAEAAGDPAGAAVWWRRLAAQEPGNSRVALRLMHALAAAGDRAGAIRHAQVHTALLREEFGAGPDPEVVALLERLRRGSSAAADPLPGSGIAVAPAPARVVPAAPVPVRPPARRAPRTVRVALAVVGALAVLGLGAALWRAAAARPEASLAVLPFVDLSEGGGEAYFSDGMTEELIHALSSVPGLRVTARTSAFQFKDRQVDIRDVGEHLGVGMVLEGSVRRSAGRVRITAQLIRTEDGSHLWSEAYDRELDDALAVQEEIARSIADALRLRLGSVAPLAARHSGDLEAYHLYLKGRHGLNQRTPAAARQAIDYFRQAIERDPRYGLAHAALAQAHTSLVDVAGVRPEVAFPKARAAALRAVELDSTLAEAHALLAWMHNESWEFAEARQAFARAFRLEPDLPGTYLAYSLYLDNMGRFEEALEATRRAQQLDPLSPIASYNVAGSYLHLARFEPAIAEARRIIELHPTLPLGYDALGWALVDAGRPVEAIEPLEKAVELGEGRWLALANLGRAYAGVGRRAEARAVLQRLERDWGELGFGNFAMAAVHLALDERGPALERLKDVYRLRHAKLPHARQWTAFEPLYGDPDFSRIVRAAGFDPPDAAP